MKKTLSILLALTLIFSLAACGKKTEQAETPVEPDESTDIVEIPGDNQNTNQPVIDTMTDEDIAKAEALARAEFRNWMAGVINSARTQDETDAFGVYTDNEMPILDLLGITEDQVEDYAVSISMMNVHAYTVALLKPIDGEADNIVSAIESYKESKKDEFKQYLVDQYEIADGAVIENDGKYIYFAMCSNAAETVENMKKAVSGDIDITEFIPELTIDVENADDLDLEDTNIEDTSAELNDAEEIENDTETVIDSSTDEINSNEGTIDADVTDETVNDNT